MYEFFIFASFVLVIVGLVSIERELRTMRSEVKQLMRDLATEIKRR